MKIYEGKENYIFISYAHDDSGRVIPIIEELARKDFRIWYDSGIEPGGEWTEDISNHIRACAKMIFFVTEASVCSRNCRNEVNLALLRNKDVLVVYLEKAELKKGLDLQLSSSQALFRDKYKSDTQFIDAITNAKILKSCQKQQAQASQCASSYIDPESGVTITDIYLSAEPDQIMDYVEETCPSMRGGMLLLAGIECYNMEQYDDAVAYFNEAALEGISEAQWMLAECYKNGQGVNKNPVKAFSLYKVIADKHGDAAKGLADCYLSGFGTEKDAQAAAHWYQKAAEKGNVQAATALGELYCWGKGVPKNEVLAFKWWKKAAEKDSQEAQYQLGNCYRYGYGVAKSYEQAIYWYQKAIDQDEDSKYKKWAEDEYNSLKIKYDAEQGDTEAQFQLAEMSKSDKEKAFYWYKKAAESNHSKAQFALALCYRHGRGVSRDPSQAFFWLEKAAEQGHGEAQSILSLCYGKGDGCVKDSQKSHFWEEQAKKNGSDNPFVWFLW